MAGRSEGGGGGGVKSMPASSSSLAVMAQMRRSGVEVDEDALAAGAAGGLVRDYALRKMISVTSKSEGGAFDWCVRQLRPSGYECNVALLTSGIGGSGGGGGSGSGEGGSKQLARELNRACLYFEYPASGNVFENELIRQQLHSFATLSNLTLFASSPSPSSSSHGKISVFFFKSF